MWAFERFQLFDFAAAAKSPFAELPRQVAHGGTFTVGTW
jgi:hypothetical protein